MNDIADYVSTGGCLSAGEPTAVALEYAKSVGKIEGLALTERAILDISEEGEAEEEQDV